jgi:predicted neuraminidase
VVALEVRAALHGCFSFALAFAVFGAAAVADASPRPSVAQPTTGKSAVILTEFVNPHPPYHTSHASTIAQTSSGTLVAAWFCGSVEGRPDVSICFARKAKDGWTPAVVVANGIQPDGKRYATWNPVLFQQPHGPLFLFYKVGPAGGWWGMVITSTDGGRTWSEPRRLPNGVLGPSKDKIVTLPDGTWLAGSETDWRVHFELSRDAGQTWQSIGPVDEGAGFQAIQPTILLLPYGLIEALCRTKQGVIAMTWSSDGGRTWTPLAATELPNPNSGIDAVKLADGRFLLVYNHSAHLPNWSGHGNRYPLDVAISRDGIKWKHVLTLEDEPPSNAPIQLSPPTQDQQFDVFGDKGFSYPAVIQTSDGLVHITYTWNRRMIKHVVIDPRKLGN